MLDHKHDECRDRDHQPPESFPPEQRLKLNPAGRTSGINCRHLIYAVDAQSGHERWKFKTNQRIRSSPAIEKQTVFFGGDDGNFYALAIETGQEKWRIKTRGPIISSASIADRIAYFGSADGHLYAVDIETGKRKWRLKAPFGWMRSSPAIGNGRIYFGGDDGNLYALY